MKLKNILLGAASAIAIFATVACQEVDPNDRLIYVKPAEAGRAVLIEDFTGQNCKNCPNGTTIINDIIKTHGEDKVIAVGIHSGPLSEDGEDGLATETGNDYYRIGTRTASMDNHGLSSVVQQSNQSEMSTRGHNM